MFLLAFHINLLWNMIDARSRVKSINSSIGFTQGEYIKSHRAAGSIIHIEYDYFVDGKKIKSFYTLMEGNILGTSGIIDLEKGKSYLVAYNISQPEESMLVSSIALSDTFRRELFQGKQIEWRLYSGLHLKD
jgi:hypothetical protein